ncbi:MAG: type II toxin-antitoxin system mRNA interferase toxin, RelE/StbE family [Patescibacteria group bacterium]|mgnify:CR=1 FL=1
MKIVKIHYSSGFLRALRKLPVEPSRELDERIELFKSDCFHSRLKTHKLKGTLQGHWAFSLNYRYRILFEFVGKGEVLFEDTGDHSIYQ